MPFHKVNSKWKIVNRNSAIPTIHHSPFTIHHKSGFSLIEILIFLLVCLAFVTVLLASAGTLDKSRSVNLSGVAGRIASCEMERLRALNFVVLPANGINVPIGSPCNADLSKLPAGATATRTIADYGSPTDPNIKQITITVTWPEAGVSQNVTLVTLKSKYGI